LLDAFLHVVRQRADVGEHHRRHVALDQGVDDDGKIGVVALGDLRERQQRALDIVERSQQRLRLLARGARDQADAMPLRAGVEQVHGPGGALAGDLDARDLVSQLQRHIEGGERAGVCGTE
jgi:hypothetical protein